MSRAVVHKPTGKTNWSQFYYYRHEIFKSDKIYTFVPHRQDIQTKVIVLKVYFVLLMQTPSFCSLGKYLVLNPIFFYTLSCGDIFRINRKRPSPATLHSQKPNNTQTPGGKEVFSVSLRRPHRLFILDFLFLLYQFSDTMHLPLANKHKTLMSPEQQEVLGKHGLLSRESLGFIIKINSPLLFYPLLTSILLFSLTFHSQISSIVCALRILWLSIAPFHFSGADQRCQEIINSHLFSLSTHRYCFLYNSNK